MVSFQYQTCRIINSRAQLDCSLIPSYHMQRDRDLHQEGVYILLAERAVIWHPHPFCVPWKISFTFHVRIHGVKWDRRDPYTASGTIGGGGGGCMWVHLHPIHTPVHPPFACVVLLLPTKVLTHCMHFLLHRHGHAVTSRKLFLVPNKQLKPNQLHFCTSVWWLKSMQGQKGQISNFQFFIVNPNYGSAVW